MEAQPIELLARHGEYIGNVELVGPAGLDADRTDEHEPVDPLRHLGRDLGGDPSADRKADDVDAGQIQPVHQFQIDMGDVVDAVEPIRQGGFSEAGMRRRDHPPVLREQIEKRQVRADAGAPVQMQCRRSLPAVQQLQLDACDGDHAITEAVRNLPISFSS